MDVVNVQFEDEERKVIVAQFSASQDPAFWINQGAVSQDDQRYIEFQTRIGLAGTGKSSATPALKRAFSFLR